MDRVAKKSARYARVRAGIRAKISGTSACPRLSVYRSNSQIYAQLIDDAAGATLASASSLDSSLKGSKDTKTETAKKVGKLLAERAKEASLSKVVFDRNGYLYHGRVKALAEAAREGGLEF